MPDNDKLSARCQFLMQATTLCQTNTKNFNAQFKDAVKETSDAIDAAVVKNGFKTTRDLVDDIAKQLPENDRQLFLKLISQNRLPDQWEKLVGRSVKDAIDNVTDFASVIVVRRIMTTELAASAGNMAKGLSFDMRLGFTYMSALSRASALGVAANEAFATQVAKVRDIATLEQEIAAEQVVGNDAAELRARMQTALAEELELANETYTLRSAALNAEDMVVAAEEAMASARLAARASLRTGVYGALVGAAILLGGYAYTRYREKKDAAHLKDAIEKLAAARLYAQVNYNQAGVYIGLMLDIQHVANDYSATNPDTYKKSMEDLMADMKSKLSKESQTEALKKAYTQLKAQDETASPHTYTGADPETLDDLTKIHEKQMKEYLEAHPAKHP